MSEPNWIEHVKSRVDSMTLTVPPNMEIGAAIEQARGLVSDGYTRKAQFMFNGQLITVERMEFV
jgi:hypothetical protein